MGEYEPNDSRLVTGQQKPTEPGKAPHWRQEEAGETKEAYEPADSRHVTDGQQQAAGAPGEGEWRAQEQATELEQDQRGDDGEAVVQTEQADAAKLDDASLDAAREDRND
jgi:hypothetical protein